MVTDSAQSLAVVEAWNDAANRQDAGTPHRAIRPRTSKSSAREGSGYGHVLLRDWVARAGLSLKTVPASAGGNLVVLAQRGVSALRRIEAR